MLFEHLSPIEIYYQNNPDATLKDYLDYEAAQRKEVADKEQERHDKCMQWYKDLEGRCFAINFNGNVFMVLKVTKWPNTEFRNKYTCYHISLNPAHISKEDSCDVNRYWFNNPYEVPHVGQNMNKCAEIPEEVYNEIVSKCEQIKSITDSVNIKQYV